MACAATWLHLSPMSHARLIPFLCRRSDFRRFHRFTSITTLPYFYTRFRHPVTAVRAQARRGFSMKEGEVASPSDLHFEAPLKIVEYPDPILRAKNKRIETFDDNLKKTDGIGLSAPQVGLNVQLTVFNPVGKSGEGEEIVLVNPGISKYSKKVVQFNEGCFSFPGIYADVKRPDFVKIDARDINGARFTFSLSGLPARVFQHEFDHLQGILFFDRMTEEVLDSIRTELQALEKKYENQTGQLSPEKVEMLKGKRVCAGFGKS